MRCIREVGFIQTSGKEQVSRLACRAKLVCGDLLACDACDGSKRARLVVDLIGDRAGVGMPLLNTKRSPVQKQFDLVRVGVNLDVLRMRRRVLGTPVE